MRVLDDSNPAQFIKTPIFKAEIEPDVRFLGFDLTASVVKGNPDPAANNPGWFFVIQERPGEPRFGLDNLSEESPETPTTGTSWPGSISQTSDRSAASTSTSTFLMTRASRRRPTVSSSGGATRADMAYILYQVPVMVAFHAADMLP